MKKKKITQWKIDFLNIITKRTDEFKKINDGTFEGKEDFETSIDILKEDIQDDIEDVKFDAETLLKDEKLRKELFYELDYDSVSNEEKAVLINILEMSGYGIVKLESLADEIRFEEMQERFDKNPYSATLLLS